MASANVAGSTLAIAGKSCAVKVAVAAVLSIAVLAALALGIEHRVEIDAALRSAYTATLVLVSFGGFFWGGVLTSGLGMCAVAWTLCASESIHDAGGKDYTFTTKERAVLVVVGASGAIIWLLGALATKSIVAGIEILTTYQTLAAFAVWGPLVVIAMVLVFLMLMCCERY